VLGQHTRELFKEYGYDDAEIDGFIEEGAVHDGGVY